MALAYFLNLLAYLSVKLSVQGHTNLLTKLLIKDLIRKLKGVQEQNNNKNSKTIMYSKCFFQIEYFFQIDYLIQQIKEHLHSER